MGDLGLTLRALGSGNRTDWMLSRCRFRPLLVALFSFSDLFLNGAPGRMARGHDCARRQLPNRHPRIQLHSSKEDRSGQEPQEGQEGHLC